MNVSQVLHGASRLPLTMKRGNKDFYKGTGQAFVPGGGHRTGPPGKHVVKGKAKFRIMDEKVRYFVGPGIETLETTQLRPYVSSLIDRKGQPTSIPTPRPQRFNSSRPSIPFGPNITHRPLLVTRPSSSTFSASSGGLAHPPTPLKIKPHDTKVFSKWYRALSHEERQRVIAEQRREWYEGQVEGLRERRMRAGEVRLVEQEEETEIVIEGKSA